MQSKRHMANWSGLFLAGLGFAVGIFAYAASASAQTVPRYGYYTSFSPFQIAGYYGTGTTDPYTGQSYYYPQNYYPQSAPSVYNTVPPTNLDSRSPYYSYPQQNYSYNYPSTSFPAGYAYTPGNYSYSSYSSVNYSQNPPATYANAPEKQTYYHSFVQGCKRIYSDVRKVVVTIVD